QWPLSTERLQQAHILVNEQLAAGHIRPSTSPWNTPIFVIPKKSGKYRLLHDLREVNAQMEDMGALQPGLPSPAMIPKDWHLLVVDLKYCFFSIRLHPDDFKRFASTVPSINRQAPAMRFEWVVLPQGMKNSPTLCQLYVDEALSSLRTTWPGTLIYHYMDDILIAQSEPITQKQEHQLEVTLKHRGLVVAPEKVQRISPIKYLGWKITDSHIMPQKLNLRTEIKTLHDMQTFMGEMQWLRPVVVISKDALEKLRPLLKGSN
ncbi:hypothetical protein N307_01711, partial [Dryobates pubescens]